MPRNTSLNWFMPALVNNSVGSFCGTREEECTSLCPLETKKSRNMRRTSEPESLRLGIGDEEILAFVLCRLIWIDGCAGREPQIPPLGLKASVGMTSGKVNVLHCEPLIHHWQPCAVQLALYDLSSRAEAARFWPPKSRDLRFPRTVTQRTDVWRQ